MKQEREKFLNLHRLPGRLTAEQTAWLLGFEEHDVPRLVQKKCLKPLGNPPRNCVKMFWLRDVEALVEDRDKLAKATEAIRRGRTQNSSSEVSFPSSLSEAA